MSLSSHIRDKDTIYDSILHHIDLEIAEQIISHQNESIPRVKHRPVEGTDFPLTGMSVIYALRDYFGGEDMWADTYAGEVYDYPHYCERPVRWVCMGLMDGWARIGSLFKKPDPKTFVPDFKPTIKDVAQIAYSFKHVIGSPSRFIADNGGTILPNPYFEGSVDVGGADANLLIGNTLLDVRTTAKRQPCSIDDVVKQVGYYLLDYGNIYDIQHISWYYTRQECIFTHPIELFLKNKTYLDENRGEYLLHIPRRMLRGI